MSDTSNWPELIHRAVPGGYEGAPPSQFSSYAVVPLCEYQMGNLLGLLKRSRDKDNGDWFGELIAIVQVTMSKLGIKELRSNFGDTFTYEAGKLPDIFSQVYAGPSE